MGFFLVLFYLFIYFVAFAAFFFFFCQRSSSLAKTTKISLFEDEEFFVFIKNEDFFVKDKDLFSFDKQRLLCLQRQQRPLRL